MEREIPPLLPERHPQDDFFICDILDATPKSDIASMEHPLFSLSTKPDMTPREYHNNKDWLKVAPSPIGLATVHDRDILIYCISQCMAKINQGVKVTKTMRLTAKELLITTNRDTSGTGYKRFQEALYRLTNTAIETNIKTNAQEIWETFHFIEKAKTIKETRDGRMLEIEIVLSDWVFDAIREKNGEILTIHKDYFRLRKPLERRLYELARKHCGTRNKEWKFKLSTLRERMGSKSSNKEFKRLIKKIVGNSSHIPDYSFSLSDETVYIHPKYEFKGKYEKKSPPSAIDKIRLKVDTYSTAKNFTTGWDVYYIETEWRRMLKEKGGDVPKKPDGSFIAYVKWYSKNNGNARNT